MRYQGRITSWKDEQGFGFITPNSGGKQVFVHITAFSNRQRRPIDNEIVTFEVNKDMNGKLKAERVQYINEKGQSNDSTLLLLFAIIFLVCMAISVFAGKLPLLVLEIYLLASICTLIATSWIKQPQNIAIGVPQKKRCISWRWLVAGLGPSSAKNCFATNLRSFLFK